MIPAILAKIAFSQCFRSHVLHLVRTTRSLSPQKPDGATPATRRPCLAGSPSISHRMGAQRNRAIAMRE
jgi:hypothetical protein